MLKPYSVRIETIIKIMVCLDSVNYRSSVFLSRKLEIPPNTVACACQQLVKAGLAQTKKGPSGGFLLCKSLDLMTAKDLIKIVPNNKQFLKHTLSKVPNLTLSEFLKDY